MRIVIIQTSEPTSVNSNLGRPMRMANLAAICSAHGHEVKMVTSNFFHMQKKFIMASETIVSNSDVDILYLNSIGYRKHIGLRRLLDHFILGIRMLVNKSFIKDADVLYIGYPPIFLSIVVAFLARAYKIPYVVDIKDMWPDTWFMHKKVFQPLGNIYFRFIRRYVLNKSSHITTISDSFGN